MRDLLEADARIIGCIAYQDDKAVAKRLGLVETSPHQSAPDADILPIRVDGERSQQQGIDTGFADFERPETDGAGQPEARFARDEGEPLNGGIAFAQPIRCLGRAAETE